MQNPKIFEFKWCKRTSILNAEANRWGSTYLRVGSPSKWLMTNLRLFELLTFILDCKDRSQHEALSIYIPCKFGCSVHNSKKKVHSESNLLAIIRILVLSNKQIARNKSSIFAIWQKQRLIKDLILMGSNVYVLTTKSIENLQLWVQK